MLEKLHLSWLPNVRNPICLKINVDAISAAILIGKHTGLVHPLIDEHDFEGVQLFLETPIEDEQERLQWTTANHDAIARRIRFEMLRPLTWN